MRLSSIFLDNVGLGSAVCAIDLARASRTPLGGFSFYRSLRSLTSFQAAFSHEFSYRHWNRVWEAEYETANRDLPKETDLFQG